ncbi:hypothetical protein Q3G72_011932 [Acer saccharum]|nr:hypothetical protein Q3G72_011932 [Acer saccharum]
MAALPRDILFYAQQLNKDIFETIYYHAMKASTEIAAKEGHYETYDGSPVSKGILQPDMWGVTPSNRWDWGALRDMIAKNGVRNSLLVAPMPTASTSQILGNNECFEPRAIVGFDLQPRCRRLQPSAADLTSKTAEITVRFGRF